jgi:hypothetical protein
MDIGSLRSGGGIQATASAIQKAQVRFDAAAENVVGAAQDLASDEPSASNGDLTAGIVNMQAESSVNQVLYGVFKRQVDQQQALMDMIQPK